jgi:hypothetical protein
MTIGPGLFWCLFGYFALNCTLAVLFEIAGYESKTKSYALTILVAVGFMVWLGVSRW